MRDINSLTKSKMEEAWAVNNNMVQEPQSMHDATERVVHILDAKNEKADLQSVISTNCTHLSLKITSYWSYSQNLRTFLTEH